MTGWGAVFALAAALLARIIGDLIVQVARPIVWIIHR